MTTPYGTPPGTGDGEPSVTSGGTFPRPYGTAPEWSGVSTPPGAPVQPGFGPGFGPGAGRGVRVRPGRRWRRKHTLGCFGSLVALVLLVLILQILITPWAFHIGNTFTPLMHWSGVSQARTANGASYAVQLNITANDIGEHACSQNGCDDFHGSMVVCTAAGKFSFNNISGKVGGWLSTDGQDMSVSFSGKRGQPTDGLLGFLHGTWHGAVYQATDGGYLDRNFNPDGTARRVFTSPDPKQTASFTFQQGNFDSACAQVERS